MPTVLIVEDEVLIRDFVSEELMEAGFETRVIVLGEVILLDLGTQAGVSFPPRCL